MLRGRSVRFPDRRDAGRRLGAVLAAMDLPGPVVLALPRGGVPVGAEVADALGAPLDVVVARKVGMPGHEEYAIGAVAEGSDVVVVQDAGAVGSLPEERFDAAVRSARAELGRRVELYRGGRPLIDLVGRTAVVVDDGLATGATAEAALSAVRAAGASRIVLAVPVGAADTVRRLAQQAEVVCLATPTPFTAVGLWYDRFDQTTDDEVLSILAAQQGGEQG